jgi:chromosome segregation ATPase
MQVNLTTAAPANLAAVAEALKDGALLAPAVAAPLLSGANVKVGNAAVDLESLLAQMRVETNAARLNAARSRLSSALGQLTDLSEEQQGKVDAIKTIGNELLDVEAARDQAKVAYEEKSTAYDRAQTTLKEAESAVKKADRRVTLAESELAHAEEDLAAFTASGVENPAELAALEKALSDAKGELTRATADLEKANKALDSAQEKAASAQAALTSAKATYASAEAKVDEMQSTFDALIDSLDAPSVNALREALRLSVGDVGHLHDEIEEEDKEHSLSLVRSVEDVIADSLKRAEGKMVDEVEKRQLDVV